MGRGVRVGGYKGTCVAPDHRLVGVGGGIVTVGSVVIVGAGTPWLGADLDSGVDTAHPASNTANNITNSSFFITHSPFCCFE